VIVAGGAVGTAGLLGRSRAHLPGLSQHLGRHLSGNGDLALAALLPADASLPGGGIMAQHQGVAMDTVCYEWLESHGFIVITQHQLTPATLVNGDGTEQFWGLRKKRVMKRYADEMVGLAVIGVDGSPGEVRTVPDQSDEVGATPAFGVSGIDFPLDRETRQVFGDARRIVGDLVERMGGTLLDVTASLSPTYDEMAYSAHPLGTARMADGPDLGVVGHDGQVFGHPGLYVTDGSSVPTALGVNPSLTIAALAERSSQLMLERLDRKRVRWPAPNPHIATT
jgi:choline dehydrogenase-like flavoprotein